MATISLNKESAEGANAKLETARVGVSALRVLMRMVPTNKRDNGRNINALKKMEEAIDRMQNVVNEASNAPTTKTAIKDALKDATPEQLAAIAALLHPETVPESDEEVPYEEAVEGRD